MAARNRTILFLKAACWIGCLIPFGLIVLRATGFNGMTLGANPVETVLHTMGKTGMNILLISLAVTPLRVLTGFNALIRLRRLLGLFSFFYVTLHFVTYAVLDLRLAWSTIFVDITERPYITLGMLSLVSLIPLAITSTHAMQRRLGRNWVRLHRLVYVAAVAAIVHFFWQVKADIREPLVYTGILAVLLGFRLVRSYRLHQRRLLQATSKA